MIIYGGVGPPWKYRSAFAHPLTWECRLAYPYRWNYVLKRKEGPFMSEPDRTTKRRPRKDVHPMRADANLPAHMTKHARKLLAKRRAEIDDEDVPTCDDIAPDWMDVPGWWSCRSAGKRTANHNGTQLECWDGSYTWRALDLNENAP